MDTLNSIIQSEQGKTKKSFDREAAMRTRRRAYAKKKFLVNMTIWLMLLASVIFMGICPPIGFALIGCVLVA